MEERQRGGGGAWSTVIIVALSAYLLGLGPSCWLTSRVGGEDLVTAVYRPLTCLCHIVGSPKLDAGIEWYSRLLAEGELWAWSVYGDGRRGYRWDRAMRKPGSKPVLRTLLFEPGDLGV